MKERKKKERKLLISLSGRPPGGLAGAWLAVIDFLRAALADPLVALVGAHYTLPKLGFFHCQGCLPLSLSPIFCLSNHHQHHHHPALY